MRAIRWLSDKAHRLDESILGPPPMPDQRPLHRRFLRPGSAVRSPKARLWYIALLAGMFLDRWLGEDSVASTVVFVLLFAGLFVVVAAGMRKGPRRSDRGGAGSR